MFGSFYLLTRNENAKLTLIRVAEGSAIVALFLILVLLLEGLVLAVEYRKVDVINVVQVPG
ncbi:hypothetical protein [Ruegeria arenilitoris]|uniref:hypothetical protein n=1 Tax=Ruegeria arenilitoris TaxID=1173585 RepID=UPI00147F4C4D|nr:hypothetical protein [Ruegeria arenilitoris]